MDNRKGKKVEDFVRYRNGYIEMGIIESGTGPM
jgi:hypothetical protein